MFYSYFKFSQLVLSYFNSKIFLIYGSYLLIRDLAWGSWRWVASTVYEYVITIIASVGKRRGVRAIVLYSESCFRRKISLFYKCRHVIASSVTQCIWSVLHTCLLKWTLYMPIYGHSSMSGMLFLEHWMQLMLVHCSQFDWWGNLLWLSGSCTHV